MNITKLARAELCMTQEQFAAHMNVPTQEQVSDWETGKTQVSKQYRERFAPLAASELARQVADCENIEHLKAIFQRALSA